MSDNYDETSSAFKSAINPTEKENAMSSTSQDYAISLPFSKHRLYTEHEITNADIDYILRPILEAHGVGLSDYDPYKLSFNIDGKTIQLSVEDYNHDIDFEGEIKFARKEAGPKKTIFISNHNSIKGTEILLDFLKRFQKEYQKSYFEEFEDVYVLGEEIQKLFIDPETLYDPDLASVLEDEDISPEYKNGN